MCIKHKVAGRCTNGMPSFRPRWCYYVHIIPRQIYPMYNIQMYLSRTWLKSLSSCETFRVGLVMGLLLYLLNVMATCLQRGPGVCLDASIRLTLPRWQAYSLILCPFLFHISTALRPWNSVSLSMEPCRNTIDLEHWSKASAFCCPPHAEYSIFSTPKWQNGVLCCRLPNDPAGIVKV